MRSADEILDALTGLLSRAKQIALLERWRDEAARPVHPVPDMVLSRQVEILREENERLRAVVAEQDAEMDALMQEGEEFGRHIRQLEADMATTHETYAKALAQICAERDEARAEIERLQERDDALAGVHAELEADRDRLAREQDAAVAALKSEQEQALDDVRRADRPGA